MWHSQFNLIYLQKINIYGQIDSKSIWDYYCPLLLHNIIYLYNPHCNSKQYNGTYCHFHSFIDYGLFYDEFQF